LLVAEHKNTSYAYPIQMIFKKQKTTTAKAKAKFTKKIMDKYLKVSQKNNWHN
jgi:hypothetical protein